MHGSKKITLVTLISRQILIDRLAGNLTLIPNEQVRNIRMSRRIKMVKKLMRNRCQVDNINLYWIKSVLLDGMFSNLSCSSFMQFNNITNTCPLKFTTCHDVWFAIHLDTERSHLNIGPTCNQREKKGGGYLLGQTVDWIILLFYHLF